MLLRKILIPLICLAALLGNVSILGHDFVWDDFDLIVRDPFIKTPGEFTLYFQPSHWRRYYPGDYRPLRSLTFAFLHLFWGINPFGYHLLNLVLHSLNAGLVYLFLRLFLGRVFPAAAGALLFALYPLQGEAVAWAKNCSELTAAFFSLLSLVLFLKAGRRSHWALALSFVSFLLALLAKPSALVLPLFLPLILRLRPWPSGERPPYRLTLPFWILSGLYLLFAAVCLPRAGAGYVNPPLLNLGERLAAARQTYASYLALLFLPLSNAPERPFPLPAAWAAPEAIAGALGTFALFLIALRSLRARSPLSLFLLWPFLSLLPASNFFPLASRPLAEQRLYFPAIGVCALIGLAGERLRELFARTGRATGRSAADCALCFLFIFFAASTAIRDRDWRNEITLFEKAKKSAPTLRVRLNLANAYLRAGESVKAVNECVELLRLDPALAEGHAALSDGYARMGLMEKAGEELERARALNPRHTGILNNLGLLYIRTGREAEAEEIFRRILSLDGENREAMNNLAACLARRGRDREAREMWERVLAIDPGDPVARANKDVNRKP